MANGLFIEQIGSLEHLRSSAAEVDIRFVEQFSCERRVREVLAWRAIVRRELGADVVIDYAPTGTPIIVGSTKHISVSHSSEYVAVAISDAPCGVDIDGIGRNYSRVASRYASDAERALSHDPLLLPALWCAKECLYKYAGRVEVDFLRDINVLAVDFESGIIRARILDSDLLTLFIHIVDAQTLAVSLP